MPSRYKFVRGGRGLAKSWSIARALEVIGAGEPKRILCTREVQKSIKQSVHQLLRDQIVNLGLESFYDVLEHEIRGKNGTQFLFAGLTDGYDCYQNALAEWVNGILKGELLLYRPADLAQARLMVRQSVEIYNTERPHLSLQCKTPDEVHRVLSP